MDCTRSAGWTSQVLDYLPETRCLIYNFTSCRSQMIKELFLSTLPTKERFLPLLVTCSTLLEATLPDTPVAHTDQFAYQTVCCWFRQNLFSDFHPPQATVSIPSSSVALKSMSMSIKLSMATLRDGRRYQTKYTLCSCQLHFGLSQNFLRRRNSMWLTPTQIYPHHYPHKKRCCFRFICSRSSSSVVFSGSDCVTSWIEHVRGREEKQ